MPIFIQYGQNPALLLAQQQGDRNRFERLTQLSNQQRAQEDDAALGWQQAQNVKDERDRQFLLKQKSVTADDALAQQKFNLDQTQGEQKYGLDKRTLDLQDQGGYYDRNSDDAYKQELLNLRGQTLDQGAQRLEQQGQQQQFGNDIRSAEGVRRQAIDAISALDANATHKDRSDPNSQYNTLRNQLLQQAISTPTPRPSVPAPTTQPIAPSVQGSGAIVPRQPVGQPQGSAWIGRPGTYQPPRANAADGAQAANQATTHNPATDPTAGKLLPKDLARQYLAAAGGDQQRAEAMAMRDGYTF